MNLADTELNFKSLDIESSLKNKVNEIQADEGGEPILSLEDIEQLLEPGIDSPTVV